MAKSASDIITALETYIKNKRSTLDTSVGSVNRDIVIEGPAEQLSDLYDYIDDVKLLATINNYADISTGDFDDIAANYGLVRLAAGKATGSVTFGTYTKPVGTITIGNADGTGGVVVQTKAGSGSVVLSYTTTETVYLTTSTVLNSVTGLYEVNAAIEANVAGTSGNTGAGTITQLGTPIAGVTSVTNTLALTNGTATETNESLYGRILEKIEGFAIGTKSSYQALVDANALVTDSLVVGPNDSDAVRDPLTGAVDIYVIGSDSLAVSQVESSDGTSTNILLRYPPVDAISSVVGVTNSEIYTTYALTDDTGQYGGSINAQDSLVWNTGTVPPAGIQYTISYTRNNLIHTLQDTLDASANSVVNSDVLVKEGTKVLVDITLSITLNSGYSSSVVTTEVSNAITTFVNAFTLGEDLEQSDLVTYISNNVAGVDSITIPFTKLARRGSSGASDLTAAAYEYFRVDGSSLTITVV